jgi:uncharacterized protein
MSSTTFHRVRLADIAPQPWRNGGGTTRELLLWPPSTTPAATQDWAVRVSVADIVREGPFSSFPGVDRWFAVVEGAGVTLTLPDESEQRLRRGDAPLQFAGTAAPGCRLIDGPTRDLNLMVRRGLGRMWKAQVGEPVDSRLRWRGLYAVTSVRMHGDAGHSETLEPGTLLWSDSTNAGRWALQEPALAYWMTLSR